MCAEFQPAVLRDFQGVLNNDRYAIERFAPAFSNIARHMGHAVMDEKMKFQKSREIEFYRQELMGKRNNAYSDAGSEYGNQCCDAGFSGIEGQYRKYINNLQAESKVTLDIAKKLLYLR